MAGAESAVGAESVEKSAVGVESVACEGQLASLPGNEEEPEASERLEEGTPEAAIEAAETQYVSDSKRKLDDLEPLEDDKASAKRPQICISEPTSGSSASAADQGTAESDEATREIGAQEIDGSGHPSTKKPLTVADGTASDSEQRSTAVEGNVEEHSGQDGETGGSGLGQVKMEKESLGNEQFSSTNNIHYTFVDDAQNPFLGPQQDGLPYVIRQTQYDLASSSRKIEVPNNKVGIIIGKSGETIRDLQINSGTRIQITRDADVGPLSSTRSVELTGTLENINKAEQLIKNVIAEADAGGSPSLVARGFSTSQPGSEQIEMQIPNGKVGVIIGKGGETIKNLQTKTGARIQLIPQHLSEGDSQSERTVRINGKKKQVESAKEMIKDVMNQPPTRSSSHSNTFRPPHGPALVTQWDPRPTPPTQPTVGYVHQQIGTYPPQTTQYPQPYSGYSQQPPAKGTYGDQQRPASASMQTDPQQPGSYDYYNQGALVPNNQQPSNPLPGSLLASTPAPMNYNYAQPQASDACGNSAFYAQQKYGHVYNKLKYDNQPPGQQPPIGPQPGIYGQQSSTSYCKPAYSGIPPSYGPARPAQSGEPMYQGAPTQQAPYGQVYAPTVGYSQQPSGGYPQQPAPVYGQYVPQSSGYSQYPSSQPSYDQNAQTIVNYGYQGAAPDAGYVGNAPSSGYAAQQHPFGSQLGYAQAPANPSGYYDQSMPSQAGYSVPGAPVGFSPQPGYDGQYDSAQNYGQL